MKRMVYVTKADIAAGERRSCYACPIALAASRAFGRRMSVGNFSITSRNDSWYGQMPVSARQFIRRFDAGSRVTPTRFMCDISK